MKQRNIAATLLITAGLFASSANASITYSIDRDIGPGVVKGTITTNGTIGRLFNGGCNEEGICTSSLATSDINGWSLTVFDGVDHFTLNPSNSGFWSRDYDYSNPSEDLTMLATALHATESELLFDFDVHGFAMFQAGEQGAAGPSWLMENQSARGPFESLWAGTREERLERETPEVYRSGRVVIGSAIATVPEPGTMALLALGLFGLGCSRKLKHE